MIIKRTAVRAYVVVVGGGECACPKCGLFTIFRQCFLYFAIIFSHRLFSVSIQTTPKMPHTNKIHKKAYFTAYVSRIFGRSCSLQLTLKDLIISNKAKQQQQNKKKTERQRDEEETNCRKLKRKTRDGFRTYSESVTLNETLTNTRPMRASRKFPNEKMFLEP